MSLKAEKQVKDLVDAIVGVSAKDKGKRLTAILSNAEIILTWLHYLRTSASNKVADRLLDSVQAAIIEAAACISMGLVRPAIFSIRVQLELFLAWIYFNDHRIEWNSTELGQRDFPLRAENLKYLRMNGPRFPPRLELLIKRKRRKNDDPYGLLSQYVHSVSAYAAPVVGPLSSIVSTDSTIDESVALQSDVVEYLSDVLASWYVYNWHDLPDIVKRNITARLTAKELQEFCS